MSRPTKFTPGNKGDIYTDVDTGIKYKCLGRLGFCTTSFREPREEYNWEEVHPSEYGFAPLVITVCESEYAHDYVTINGVQYPATNATNDLSSCMYTHLGDLIDRFTLEEMANCFINVIGTSEYFKPTQVMYYPEGEYGHITLWFNNNSILTLCRSILD